MLAAPQRSGEGRTLAGVIYFTNNSPKDVDTFPIELFNADEKLRLAATAPDAHHTFRITDLEPGEYVLRLTWPKHCTLRYRVDLRKESKTKIRVIMDAACAHDDGALRELDDN